MKSSLDNSPRYLAYMVHGTFSSEHGWPTDSLLVSELRQAGIEPVSFAWSGDNSQLERTRASTELAEKIRDDVQRSESNIAIVGHSHGGTVAHYAVNLLPSEFQRRVRIVTLGSPIICTTVFSKAQVLVTWRRGILALLRSLDLFLWMYLYTVISRFYGWANVGLGMPRPVVFAVCGIAIVVWYKNVLGRCLEMWLFDGELFKDVWLAHSDFNAGQVEIRRGGPPGDRTGYPTGLTLVSKLTHFFVSVVANRFDSKRTRPAQVATNATSLFVYNMVDEAIVMLNILKWLQRQLFSLSRLFAGFSGALFKLNTKTAMPFMLFFPLWHAELFPKGICISLLIVYLGYVVAVVLVPFSMVVAALSAAVAQLVLFQWYGFGAGFSGLLWGSVDVNASIPGQQVHRVPLRTVMKRRQRGLLIHCEYYNLPSVVKRVTEFLCHDELRP